ncbi:SGNH hydrolase domain-containing protein [Variovorax boronicumulans]|uniref:SGNH hydrolase domain-containing protein n=1 Tax=Variovorax boronicumulans TaxID=436515 RepID=UPI003B96E5C1
MDRPDQLPALPLALAAAGLCTHPRGQAAVGRHPRADAGGVVRARVADLPVRRALHAPQREPDGDGGAGGRDDRLRRARPAGDHALLRRPPQRSVLQQDRRRREGLGLPGRPEPDQGRWRGAAADRAGQATGAVLRDSHVEQYGPRAVELSKTSPGTLDSLSFVTWGACPPIPNVVDEQNNLCGERRDGGMRLAMSDRFDAVVFGGCWNCYFTETGKPNAENAAADRYYFFDGKDKRRFMGGGGVDFSLNMLETVLTTLAKHKQVYLLLDNPVGEGFGPEEFIKGGRLGDMQVGKMSPTAPWDARQKALHERMRQIAQRSGAIVIDPIPTLCQKDWCTRADADATPIYKDAGHLRAEYVRSHATYMDPAMTSAPAR